MRLQYSRMTPIRNRKPSVSLQRSALAASGRSLTSAIQSSGLCALVDMYHRGHIPQLSHAWRAEHTSQTSMGERDQTYSEKLVLAAKDTGTSAHRMNESTGTENRTKEF